MTRKEIQEKIADNKKEMGRLGSENYQLEIDSILLSDEHQQYKELEEDVVERKRNPKKATKKTIGRIYWREGFKDEDTGETIYVDRNMVVRVNGEWVF